MQFQCLDNNINWKEMAEQSKADNFKRMEGQYKTNPKEFVIDLVLQSVQFYENYEK